MSEIEELIKATLIDEMWAEPSPNSTCDNCKEKNTKWDVGYATESLSYTCKQVLAALAEGAPELKLSEQQILRLLPAQALVDFDQAENTLKTLWKMAWNDISAHYQARIALLETRLADLKADRLTYCAYCGEEFPLDAAGTPEAVTNHIHTCYKHPIQDYKAEIERLEAELAMFEPTQDMREQVAKLCYQFAFLIDDKNIKSRWKAISDNERARFYDAADSILSFITGKETQ